MPRARGGLKQLTEHGVIEKRDAPLSDYAATQPDWETFTSGLYSIRPLSGRELIQAQQVESMVTHEIYGRWVPGITSAMRLRLNDGRIFQFVGTPTEFERRQWVRIQAIETVSDYGTS